MGVHDYTCSVCSEPSSFTCKEATGGECEEEGFGNDEVFVDLVFFPNGRAPEDADSFESRLGDAVAVKSEKRGYDWGAWEFVPSLNYRTLLMDDRDATGVWRLKPFDERYDEGSPIELDIPDGQTVWAVNYCPSCHEQFVARTAAAPPCRLHLEKISEHLGLPLGDDKPAFVAAVRDRVARRRPKMVG